LVGSGIGLSTEGDDMFWIWIVLMVFTYWRFSRWYDRIQHEWELKKKMLKPPWPPKRGISSPPPLLPPVPDTPKTITEIMESVGLTVHNSVDEGCLAPRSALLGHVFIDEGGVCNYCGEYTFKLSEVVELNDGSEGPVMFGHCTIGLVCDKCGHVDLDEGEKADGLGRPVLFARHGENMFDVLGRLAPDWKPVGDLRTTEAEIAEFEEKLNKARMRKSLLIHQPGSGRSREPYRGDTKKEVKAQ